VAPGIKKKPKKQNK